MLQRQHKRSVAPALTVAMWALGATAAVLFAYIVLCAYSTKLGYCQERKAAELRAIEESNVQSAALLASLRSYDNVIRYAAATKMVQRADTDQIVAVAPSVPQSPNPHPKRSLAASVRNLLAKPPLGVSRLGR